MNEYPKVSETIFDAPKSNTEAFLEIVKQYFPEAIKDGEVDFDALKEEMGEFNEVGSEHYDFTWAGKQAAKKEALNDIVGRTLKFKPDDSVNADTTENIYIEGDNLEALKLLRRNYYGKIKMIYIDPPYNTGNDFVYKDKFAMTEEELAELSGNTVDGIRMQKNSKDSAKYHTNWLNMMYPRLKLARDLLTDDGVIFISIDDGEVAQLRKICDEVFGEKNFVGRFVWKKKGGAGNTERILGNIVEHIICYAKSLQVGIFNYRSFEREYKYSDSKGKYNLESIEKTNEGMYERKTMLFPITDPKTGIKFYPSNGKRWTIGEKTCETFLTQNKLYFDYKNGTVKRIKRSEDYEQSDNVFLNLLLDHGSLLTAKNEIQSLIGVREAFETPKPVALIRQLMEISCNNDSLILDFFSGSATTAHAVMQLNAEDGGNRKFIMVQLPEVTDEKSEAYKAGYKNICEIGKERIRRAAKKIHDEKPDAKFDDGFKVFTVGDTNIRWTHDALNGGQLEVDDIQYSDKDKLDFMPGYKDIDVVYEIMLRQYGIPLSTPIETLSDVSDRTYIFADAVVVCLDEDITDELIDKLAALEPTPGKYILRDSAFGDDIEFKDKSYRRLSALIQTHLTEDEQKSKRKSFTVEFI